MQEFDGGATTTVVAPDPAVVVGAYNELFGVKVNEITSVPVGKLAVTQVSVVPAVPAALKLVLGLGLAAVQATAEPFTKNVAVPGWVLLSDTVTRDVNVSPAPPKGSVSEVTDRLLPVWISAGVTVIVTPSPVEPGPPAVGTKVAKRLYVPVAVGVQDEAGL